MTKFLIDIPEGSVLTSDEAKFIEKYYVEQSKWVEVSNPYGTEDLVCSKCGFENRHWQTRWVACPQCGRMIRGDEK